MAYEQLPIVEVDLEQLLLDLENYRIPTRRDDEAGALKYLFASEDVLGAARLILRDGYFDNEVPIVTSASVLTEALPTTCRAPTGANHSRSSCGLLTVAERPMRCSGCGR